MYPFKALCVSLLIACTQPLTAQLITLDLEQAYQTIDRWENGAYLPSGLSEYIIDDLVDLSVDSLGINRLRLEVRSGSENQADNYQLYQDSLIEYSTWRSMRYATMNDNDDPDSIDWRGFHFTELDEKIEDLVIPIRNRLLDNGEDLYINLCYVAFTRQLNGGDGGSIIHQEPEEYAEFMAALFLHMDSTYGFVPDAIEVILEPNVASFGNATLVGQCLVAAGDHLDRIGYNPDFIACSNTNLNGALNYYSNFVAVPGVSNYWTEYSFHAYAGRSRDNLIQLATNAAQSGVKTSMLEWWANGNTFSYLHECLQYANISSFEFTGSFGSVNNDWNSGLLSIAENGVNSYNLDLQYPTKYFRHYFKLIKPGAVRYEASSDSASFNPLVFRNPDGNLLLNIDATAAGTVQIVGLPAGTYQTIHTLGDGKREPSVYWEVSPIDTVLADESLTVDIPGQGIFSILQRSTITPTAVADLTATAHNFALSTRGDMLHIAANGGEKIAHVAIYSLDGQQLYTKTYEAVQHAQINWSQLRPRICVVQINGQFTEKVFLH